MSELRQAIGYVSSTPGQPWRLASQKPQPFRFVKARVILVGSGDVPACVYAGWDSALPVVNSSAPAAGSDNFELAQAVLPVGKTIYLDLGAEETHDLWFLAADNLSFSMMLELDIEPFLDSQLDSASRDTDWMDQDWHLQVANPATGADWFAYGPFAQNARILGITATLMTSSTVANRFPRLQIQDPGSSTLGWGDPAPAQAASTSVVYQWRPNAQPNAQNGLQVLGMPAFRYTNDNRAQTGANDGPNAFGMNTTGLQAGDRWIGIVVVYRVTRD